MVRLLCIALILPVLGLVQAEISNKSKYCALCPYHGLCLGKSPGPMCQNHKGMPPTNEEKGEIVHRHNVLRNTLANGDEDRGDPGPQYPATNMMKVEWDDELARIAQMEADQCVYGHDCKACRSVIDSRFNVGQNIAVQWSTVEYTSVNYSEMAERWYEKEIGLMGYQTVKEYESGDYGHCSQFTWWNSRLIGCGAAMYTRGKYYYRLLYCDYGSSGNSGLAGMYNVGKPGSKCPEGTLNNDPVYDALCVIQSPLPHKTFHTDGDLLGREGKYQSAPTCKRRGFARYY